MLRDKLSVHHVWESPAITKGLFFGVSGVQALFSGCRGRCFGCESPLQVPDDIGMSVGNLVDRVLDFFGDKEDSTYVAADDPQYIYLQGCDILSQGVEKVIELVQRLSTETDAYLAMSTTGYPIDQLQQFVDACPTEAHLFVKPYSRASGKFDFYSPKLMDILTAKDLLWLESESVEDTLVWQSRLSSIMQSDDSPMIACVPEHGLREALEVLKPAQEKSSLRFAVGSFKSLIESRTK